MNIDKFGRINSSKPINNSNTFEIHRLKKSLTLLKNEINNVSSKTTNLSEMLECERLDKLKIFEMLERERQDKLEILQKITDLKKLLYMDITEGVRTLGLAHSKIDSD